MKSQEAPRVDDGPRSARVAPTLNVAAALLAVLGAACNDAPAPRGPSGPVEVGVITVASEPVSQKRELPGRTSAFRVAEVRARVNGIVLERLFEEGADVTKGAPLFRIDPLPYQAALDSALAGLARARANEATTKLRAERIQGLLASEVVSEQEVDDAVAAHKAALADVAAGEAAVQAARINLGYTRVTSPIAGRIGRSEVTEGAYAQQAQATLMATVQQLDPIYVDLTQSSTEVLRLQRQLEAGDLVRSGDGAKVHLVFEDGTRYGEEGTLQFADVSVNPTTGSITLRALFPNPRLQLLPGMFVRAELEEGTSSDAILIPQGALRRDAQGQASVLLVGAGEKVELRAVQAPRAVGNKWRVTEGLVPGDRVIVEGLQKVRPGAEVRAVPAGSSSAEHASNR